MSSYQRERESLGERLRELRRDARLTGQQLAEPHGWNQSKVSRIEAGKQTPSDDDIRAWTMTCGAPNETADLLSALRTLEGHYRQFRRQFRSGMANNQRQFQDLEEKTSFLRNFENVFIPGLLQTPAYAWHRLSQGVTYNESADDIDLAVDARMQRQRILYAPGRRFQIIATEASLRYRLCPADAMREQLDRLVSATTLRNIQFGLIPFDAPYSIPPTHGFWIFDEEAVSVETFAAELRITEPTEIALYLRIFDDLSKVARYGTEARAVIQRALTDLDLRGTGFA